MRRPQACPKPVKSALITVIYLYYPYKFFKLFVIVKLNVIVMLNVKDTRERGPYWFR